MHSIQLPLLAAGFSLITTAMADYYSFKGYGGFGLYTGPGEDDYVGCLTVDGEWTNGGECGVTYASGEGEVNSVNGHFTLTEDLTITAVPDDENPAVWYITELKIPVGYMNVV
ncbi:hypothetical protein BO94DRAFT_601543 [Aspergillus sclerotioniger CBS 115572]|uniref:Uncharacterized protein n=1 Tax=Aspergillus sclerotioniger CBS 115572 TaxID=1450535 RepID=A0A317W5H3_9EURO|nr:hypothetical protein BO94DRAFT_601543 [Aspergillus sclerotioniger CBS 115572]PWY81593.1 hypothetical protein BO94DRAFT_601543 [Aspergillus sclerotioniger CBS 115572]